MPRLPRNIWLVALTALVLGGVVGFVGHHSMRVAVQQQRAAQKDHAQEDHVVLLPDAHDMPSQRANPAVVPIPQPADIAAAWQRNAVPVAIPVGARLITIVIDDMGVDRRRSARVASLPGPLTLAFLPYAREFERQIQEARAQGHEILVHVPMEPRGREDPGPDALRVGLDNALIRARLAAALDRADSVVGINNHMGSRFTEDRHAMQPVLAELKVRGLLFLDSVTSPDSVGTALARELDVPSASRDVFLDHDPSPGAVRARLAELESVASRHGYAIGIGHPRDATIDALDPWLREVGARGYALVPISAIVQRRLEQHKATRQE